MKLSTFMSYFNAVERRRKRKGGAVAVNHAPTDVTLVGSTVADNVASGTVIGALSTTDADAGNTFTYSLQVNPSSYFAISGANLVTNAANIPWGTYSITVRSTDQGALFFDRVFAITVTISDTNVSAIVGSFTTPPTTARTNLIYNLVSALKTAGIWTRLDLLYVCAAADSQASTINWMNPGTNTLVAAGSPTFTADRGWTGVTTTGKLSTGFNPSSATGRKLSQNDCSVGAYVNPTSSTLTRSFGNIGLSVLTRNGAAKDTIEVSGTSAVSYGGVTANAGFATASRADSANASAYFNGANLLTQANASSALANTTMDVCGGGSNSSTNASPHQIRAAFCGQSLDATAMANFYTAIQAYMTGVGANL